MDLLNRTLLVFWELMTEMSPYLLLGFLFAGILHVVISPQRVVRFIGKKGFYSSLKAALIGVPLPLCSCGVIPTGISFYKNGASKGATNSFLISTPQTGVDSILLTYSVMGPFWALFRPLIALITGVFGGVITDRLMNGQNTEKIKVDEHKSTGNVLVQILKYGFIDFLGDISRPLILGIVLAVIITLIIPPQFFSTFSHYPILNMLLVLAGSIPLYVCATGSIPIAGALLIAGVSPGAVLVFLMAGPATNISTITVLWRSMGKKSTLIYLFSIVLGALSFGVIIDYLLPANWFNLSSFKSNLHHHETFNWLTFLAVIVLVFMLFFVEISKLIKPKFKLKDMTVTYEVEGMTCNHCKKAVEQAVCEIEGVIKVEAFPQSNTVKIEGNPSQEAVKDTVEKLGYIFKSVK